MQIYTYDDVTVGKGVWHDHLDNNEITEGVLMTTIKLCVSTLYKEITGEKYPDAEVISDSLK